MTNNDEVCIPSLSSILTISQVFMPIWWWNFKNKEWGFRNRFLRTRLAILRCWLLKTHPGISIFCISLIPIHQVDMKTSVKIMVRMFVRIPWHYKPTHTDMRTPGILFKQFSCSSNDWFSVSFFQVLYLMSFGIELWWIIEAEGKITSYHKRKRFLQ